MGWCCNEAGIWGCKVMRKKCFCEEVAFRISFILLLMGLT